MNLYYKLSDPNDLNDVRPIKVECSLGEMKDSEQTREYIRGITDMSMNRQYGDRYLVERVSESEFIQIGGEVNAPCTESFPLTTQDLRRGLQVA